MEMQLDLARIQKELEMHQHEVNLRMALIHLYQENIRLKAQAEQEAGNGAAKDGD